MQRCFFSYMMLKCYRQFKIEACYTNKPTNLYTQERRVKDPRRTYRIKQKRYIGADTWCMTLCQAPE